jgi:ElaB/YqjD/DUF883 family membrane-anchored ribosome-binding protein
MKSTESFVEESKTQWNKVKSEIDHLGVQLTLGRSEAKEAFEREWKKFSGFLDEQSHRLRRQSYWINHLLEELKQRSAALKTTLKQTASDSDKSFATWREGVLRVIYELEFIVDQLYPNMEDSEKELLSTYRIKMEVYRTRLIMTDAGEVASLHMQAAQLADKADDVLVWLDSNSETARDKMQRFGKEIGASFEQMKHAFGELFK